MKTLLYAVGVTIVAALALAGAANAQISEPGPYYALPSWDQQFPASTRWVVLTNWGTPPNAAVLDRETGLVWQQSPFTGSDTWVGALVGCQLSITGGRFGWRLPALEELLTLADPNTMNLFAGAPFTLGSTNPSFWTATTNAGNTSLADAFLFGTAAFDLDKNANTPRFWCVRGYQGTQNPQ